MTDHSKGLLITALGVLFIVPDSLFVRLIDTDTLTVAFWRNLTSGVVATVGLLILSQGNATKAVQAIRATGWQGIVYAGGVCASGIMFVAAVRLTSVANVVFILAAMPIFAALFSRIVLGERIGRRMVLTMLAVAVGLTVIAYGSSTDERTSLYGDAVALTIAIVFAFALTAARTKRHVPMAPAVPAAFLLGALVLWPFADVWSIPDGQWWMVAAHGGFFIVMSMTLLSIGPRFITSAEVALLVLLESVLAPLLVWWVIGEFPGEWVLAGGVIVLGALLVSNLVVLRRRRQA